MSQFDLAHVQVGIDNVLGSPLRDVRFKIENGTFTRWNNDDVKEYMESHLQEIIFDIKTIQESIDWYKSKILDIERDYHLKLYHIY
jgi:hypothetical protein